MMVRRTKDVHPRPLLPSVNLLSHAHFERMAARRLRQRFVAGGVGLVVLVGAAWGAQHMRVDEARKLVAVEQSETTRLDSETHRLAPVEAFVSGVKAQVSTVEGAMADEIYFSEVLDGVRDATPVGAQITSLSVSVASTDPSTGTTGAATCPGPDPFNTKTVVGCVTLSGTAASRADVGRMVVQLGASHLFVEPFISTTTTGDAQAVTFSGSVGLSEKVFSRRYAKPTTPATPAPATTTEGGVS